MTSLLDSNCPVGFCFLLVVINGPEKGLVVTCGSVGVVAASPAPGTAAPERQIFAVVPDTAVSLWPVPCTAAEKAVVTWNNPGAFWDCAPSMLGARPQDAAKVLTVRRLRKQTNHRRCT